MQKIIYWLSILSFCFFTFSIVGMLPFIFQIGGLGILFLLSTIFLIFLELMFLVRRKELVQEAWTYNILVVLSTMYLSIVYYQSYYSHLKKDLLDYSININYLQKNYFLITLLIIVMIIYLFILRKKSNFD